MSPEKYRYHNCVQTIITIYMARGQPNMAHSMGGSDYFFYSSIIYSRRLAFQSTSWTKLSNPQHGSANRHNFNQIILLDQNQFDLL